MNKKWFNSAALAGSGFEHIADETVELETLTNDRLKDIDILFTNDMTAFFNKFKGFQFVVVVEREISRDSQEKFLLENPGNFFISRIGHDITNLFSPFEHFEYIEEDLIKQRIIQGVRFGRQINIIGHLLQSTGKLNDENADFNEMIQTIVSLCRKNNLQFEMTNLENVEINTLPPLFLFNYVIDEIISNWVNHGSGGYKIDISDRKIVFSNNFNGKIDPARAKAKLRCPFRRKNTGTGTGLGLYIVSLASVRGGFDWDISIHESSFSLSLFF